MTLPPPSQASSPGPGPEKAPTARLGRLARRVATGVPLALAAGALIWAGPGPFTALVLLFALFGASEFYDLVERKGFRPARRLGMAAAALAVLLAWRAGEASLAQGVALLVALIMAWFVLRGAEGPSALVDGATTLLGFLYCGWLPAHLVLLRKVEAPAGAGPGGLGLVAWLVVVCAATDIGAYFVGKALGRTRLCPRISPGKTLEGSVGGLLAALLLGWYLAGWLQIPPFHALALAALGSVTAQVGDLWESILKRDAGVKDSGHLLGSHGGVLDRFDSYLLVAPVSYLYVTWFM